MYSPKCYEKYDNKTRKIAQLCQLNLFYDYNLVN